MIHREYYTTTINVGVHFVKQARAALRNSYVLRCLRPSLYLYFPYPGDHLAKRRSNSGEDARGRVRRDTVELPWIHLAQTNDSFRAGKSPDSRGPAFAALFSPAPVGPRTSQEIHRSHKIIFPASPPPQNSEAIRRRCRPVRYIRENFLLHSSAIPSAKILARFTKKNHVD